MPGILHCVLGVGIGTPKAALTWAVSGIRGAVPAEEGGPQMSISVFRNNEKQLESQDFSFCTWFFQVLFVFVWIFLMCVSSRLSLRTSQAPPLTPTPTPSAPVYQEDPPPWVGHESFPMVTMGISASHVFFPIPRVLRPRLKPKL